MHDPKVVAYKNRDLDSGNLKAHLNDPLLFVRAFSISLAKI